VRLREQGQGYTEYTILLALIAIAAYAAVQLLGTNVSKAMSGVAGSV
jgi:Flp pilus assembly pilin Flp